MIFPGFPGVLSFSRFSRSSGNPVLVSIYLTREIQGIFITHWRQKEENAQDKSALDHHLRLCSTETGSCSVYYLPGPGHGAS